MNSMNPTITYSNGLIILEYRDKYGQLHREDGPAVVWSNGYKAWWRNDRLYRADRGPVIINSDGSQEWRLGSNKRKRK